MIKECGLKKVITYILLSAFLFFISWFCNKETDGFSIARITSELPQGLKWSTPELSANEKAQLENALAQKYRYLSSGGQCFAFVSQDNHYVIKFFKTHFYKMSSLTFQSLPFIPEATRKKKWHKAIFKLNRDFNSYLLASQDLKQETGTMYVHLNKSTDLKKKIYIFDKLGIGHEIDLDQFEFAVQKRAELAFPYIHFLIKNAEFAKAREAMCALIKLSLSRCRKGFFDEDARIHCNFGFLEARPIFIDIGRFIRDPGRQNRDALQKDFKATSSQLISWIEANYPHLICYFKEAFDAISIED